MTTDDVSAADTFDVERGPDVFTPLAQAAYEAYSARTRGRSAVSGAKLPAWDELREQPTGELVQSAWRAAAKAVAIRLAYPPGIGNSTRERTEFREIPAPVDSDVSTGKGGDA